MTPNKPQPHKRGLIAATAGFAIAVACVVVWMELPDSPDGGSPGRVSTPTFPQFRPAQSRSASPSTAKSSLIPGQDETFARRHTARGATVGTATVLDGDLIEVNGTRFRLVDIRAIAGYRHDGPSTHRWPRGTTPAQALRLKTGGAMVACYDKGHNERQERLGQCVQGEIDLGGWMIEHGMALPTGNRSDYRTKQAIAKREAHGWWYTQRED